MQISPLLLLQQRFSKLIQSGVSNPVDIELIGILNQPPISVQQRFDIYQNAYSQRILESFEEDFPKIREILDENLFSKLVYEYLQKYPSNYWSLAEVGKNLSQFISSSSWGTQYEYLADLAQFESHWALHLENITQQHAWYVIYQKEGEVLHNVVSQIQWDILTKIFQGFSIGKIIESMPDVQESEVTNLFSLLVSENIITHFTI